MAMVLGNVRISNVDLDTKKNSTLIQSKLNLTYLEFTINLKFLFSKMSQFNVWKFEGNLEFMFVVNFKIFHIID